MRVVGVEQDQREFADFYAAAWDDRLRIVMVGGTWQARDRASSSSRVGLRPPDSSRDRVLTGPGAVHQALLFRQLGPHVTVLAHTAPAFTPERRTSSPRSASPSPRPRSPALRPVRAA
jgi:hypothetical protein